MTCPTLERRAPAARAMAQVLRNGDAPAVQLVRFAVAGGLASAVQVLLFATLAPIGALTANVIAWAVSTMLANELHRRRTFHAEERVGWLAAQWKGGGLSLLGLAATSGALTLLAVVVPGAGVATQTVLVLAVNTVVGVARFAALRWSFVVRRTQSV